MVFARRRKSYEIDMLNGPLLGKILRFSFSLLLTNVLQLLYNAADLIIIGQFSGSETSVAAVGATGSLTNLIVNLFVGLSVGTGIVIAKHYGAKDFKEVEKCLHTSVAISVISGIFLAIVVWFAAPPLLSAMDTPTENNVLSGAITYMRIYFLFKAE